MVNHKTIYKKTTGKTKCKGENNNTDIKIHLSMREKNCLDNMNKKDLSKIITLLGSSSVSNEDQPLRILVLKSNLPDNIKLMYFKEMELCETEKYVTRVRASINIPINIFAQTKKMRTKKFLDDALNRMEDCITGHCEAKREVLKLLCRWKHGSIGSMYGIGLEGKPGIGKTTFVNNAIKEATGLPMVFISLSGCTDATYLTGNIYTYEGSTYGRLVHGLIESKCSNPIIYFDELDKISNTEKGQEIVNTLISVIDPAQNSHIRDKYFPFDVDFSKCMFIFSYNDPEKVSPILLDRIKRIQLETPTLCQKRIIVNKHIIPKYLSQFNSSYSLDKEVIEKVLIKNSFEAGMRSTEKDIEHIISCAFLTKHYGSCSILGETTKKSPSNIINMDFVKDIINFDQEQSDHTSMMYT